MADEEVQSYAIYCKKCGRMVGATVLKEENRKDVAKDIAQWMRAGFDPQLTTVGAVRAADWCECYDKKQEPAQPALF